MLDAHCHIHFEEFDGSDPVSEAAAAGLRGLVVSDYDSERRSALLRLAQRRGVWATCGLHPWAVGEDPDRLAAELDLVRAAHDDHDWVGVGEFGLDLSSRHRHNFELQITAARAHLQTARRHDLPVVLHIVAAHAEMLELLDEEGPPACGGMCHGFSGTAEQARAFVERGLHISIGTNAARGNVGRVREVCRAIPSGWMLVETDSPSRPPDGVDAPNHPRYLSRVIEAVASFVDEDPSTVAKITEHNARHLFDLGDVSL